jgi:DNA-binding response OmpR family regulator
MPPPRILVASADADARRVVQEALEAKGYEVVIAEEGDAALKEALRQAPELFIVDTPLPRVDGTTLIRGLRTRAAYAFIPAIFLADRTVVEGKIRGFKIGSDDFLGKPVDPEELELRVTLALKVRKKAETTVRAKLAEGGGEWSVVLSGFRGSLEEVALPSLMSLLEMEQKSGLLVLLLDGEPGKARIHFRNGRALRAKLDNQSAPSNQELIYRLLSRTRGQFDFRPVAVEEGDEINTATTQILLEAARRIDESQRKAETL